MVHINSQFSLCCVMEHQGLTGAVYMFLTTEMQLRLCRFCPVYLEENKFHLLQSWNSCGVVVDAIP